MGEKKSMATTPLPYPSRPAKGDGLSIVVEVGSHRPLRAGSKDLNGIEAQFCRLPATGREVIPKNKGTTPGFGNKANRYAAFDIHVSSVRFSVHYHQFH